MRIRIRWLGNVKFHHNLKTNTLPLSPSIFTQLTSSKLEAFRKIFIHQHSGSVKLNKIRKIISQISETLRLIYFNVMGSQDIDLLNCVDYSKDYKGLRILQTNQQIKELQTILRDKNTSRSDFKFYADRLIRLVIEDSLNQLPFTDCKVVTPTGATYEGLKYKSGNCGVSIVRSGEAMEQGLRDCCRSIRIGKILVESDMDTHEARVVYARFPEDIAQRQVLLMYPIMSTGNTVSKAINVLKEHGVKEESIILSNLFCTPQAVQTVLDCYPKMKILTSEVHPVAPNHFGQKYFGTD